MSRVEVEVEWLLAGADECQRYGEEKPQSRVEKAKQGRAMFALLTRRLAAPGGLQRSVSE